MNYIELALQNGLQIINTLLLVACALTCRSLRWKMSTQDVRAAELQTEPGGYDDSALQELIAAKFAHLDRRLDDVRKSQNEAPRENAPAPVPPLKNELPVEYAIRMARGGATVNDLVTGCGLNIGEAQLLLRMHAPMRTPPSSARH